MSNPHPDDPTPRPGDGTTANPPSSGTIFAGQDTPPAYLLDTATVQPTIPGYEVRGEIARGGMGAILAARELALDREVAIKVLLPGFRAADAAERFVTESRITARLPHPGIPPVHALGELPDGAPFLAMKLIRGRTLADLLRERPDPAHDLPKFVGVFEQVCQAVAFAHAQGIIHRDLKPGNVMVGSFGEVQVMDWGLAKPADITSDADLPGVSDITPSGMVLGTPAYMAPEQAGGEPTDARTDVFALGGILCTVLTGHAPFEGRDVRMTLGLAVLGDVSAARARLAACRADAELVELCERCLSPDPAGRPADAGVLAAEVAAYRAGVDERLRKAETERAAAEARADAEAAKAAEQRKRRRTQLLLAAAVVVLLLGGSAFAWREQRAKTRQAELEADQIRADGERRELAAIQKEKATQTRGGLVQVFKAADGLRRQYKFAEAEEVLRYGLHITGVAGLDDRRADVERALADLAFVRELDEIGMRKSIWVWTPGEGSKGRFDTAAAAPAYRKAFLARGLDLAAGDPAVVAARVRESAVREELVAALDDWAAHEPDKALWGRLLEVARLADPDPWTDRLRDPAVVASADAIARLARDADPARTPPPAVVALAVLMNSVKLDPVPVLRSAQVRNPANFRLLFVLGQLHLRRDPRQGAAYYRAALALRPGHLAASINLASCLVRGGEPDDAVAVMTGLAADHPGVALVQLNLGEAWAARGNAAAALAAFDAAIALNPNLGLAHHGRGRILTARGDTAGAVAAFGAAVAAEPDTGAYYSLGLARKTAGDLDGAAAAYRAGIGIDPTYPKNHHGLGVVLQAKGNVDGAIAAYREALRLEGDDSTTHYNLANNLKAKGDTAGAVAHYREAVRLNPANASAHNNLGNTLSGAGDLDGAIASYRAAVRADPNYALAHNNLGFALWRTGDVDAAAASYRESVRCNPKFATAHNNLGRALWSLGDLPGAEAAYREAARLDPKRYGGVVKQFPLKPRPPVAPRPREVKH